jgi:rhodanese-related sulfurtransferase
MALLLNRHGYTNVHPLSGGLEGWRQAGFGVEPMHVDAALAVTAR